MNIEKFIVVDDDPINNSICKIILKKEYNNIDIKTFTDPEQGYSYISSLQINNQKEFFILLLDINMPTWTGWDFLDQFELLNENIKNYIKIFILSSSVDSRDIERAQKNKYVMDYIVKPLTQELLNKHFGKMMN